MGWAPFEMRQRRATCFGHTSHALPAACHNHRPQAAGLCRGRGRGKASTTALTTHPSHVSAGGKQLDSAAVGALAAYADEQPKAAAEYKTEADGGNGFKKKTKKTKKRLRAKSVEAEEGGVCALCVWNNTRCCDVGWWAHSWAHPCCAAAGAQRQLSLRRCVRVCVPHVLAVVCSPPVWKGVVCCCALGWMIPGGRCMSR